MHSSSQSSPDILRDTEHLAILLCRA